MNYDNQRFPLIGMHCYVCNNKATEDGLMKTSVDKRGRSYGSFPVNYNANGQPVYMNLFIYEPLLADVTAAKLRQGDRIYITGDMVVNNHEGKEYRTVFVNSLMVMGRAKRKE